MTKKKKKSLSSKIEKKKRKKRRTKNVSAKAKSMLIMKRRMLVLLLMFFLIVAALSARLAKLQIVEGDELSKMAFEQQNSKYLISPVRGVIYDRNGKELAVSKTVYTITASPVTVVENEKPLSEISSELGQLLGIEPEELIKKFKKDTRYELLAKKIDSELGLEIREWKTENDIIGIYVYEDTKRYYPYDNLAAHVIGFTGTDNQGLDGIEAIMDNYLKGTPGKVMNEVDVLGMELPFSSEKKIDAQDGYNIVLTIDETIQYLAEKALEQALIDNNVQRGGSIIVMDPRNGDILAMVSKPDYNLNDPWACPEGADSLTWNGHTTEDTNYLWDKIWRNKAVSYTYEPGSTFKAITTAAALEENVVSPDEMVTDAPIKLYGWTINCWRTPIHGTETFIQAVYNSCNPVFATIALRLGVDRFYNYLRNFGFYERTGVQLTGEQISNIHTKPTELDMAVASFGQRFEITPIQLIAAYCSIANGGYLMEPRIIKELTDSNSETVVSYEPRVVRQVISEKTSETLRDILEGVVSEGTGRNAFVRGYRVAGKTGTSQTTKEGVYIASFAAFAPADNPVIAVLVILDDPKGVSYYGGTIAAPVAGQIIEEVLSYKNVPRRGDEDLIVKEVFVPEVRNKTLEEAKAELKASSLGYIIEGNTEGENVKVIQQFPMPGTALVEDSIVILYTYEPDDYVSVKVPNLANKNVYEATQILNGLGLNIKVTGSGIAMQQSYEAGSYVPKGEVVEVIFRYLDTVE